MQYMLLIFSTEAERPQMGTAESNQNFAAYNAFSQDIRQSGHMVAGDALQNSDTATTVSIRNGENIIVDGPFAETKEQFGGYYLIEAKDMQEAQSIALRIPTATSGRIEMRPVMQF